MNWAPKGKLGVVNHQVDSSTPQDNLSKDIQEIAILFPMTQELLDI
jgi:hypothetical protein